MTVTETWMEIARLAVTEGRPDTLIKCYRNDGKGKVPPDVMIECGLNAAKLRQYTKARKAFRIARSAPHLQALKTEVIERGNRELGWEIALDIHKIGVDSSSPST
jgi:hypothetical protein